MDGEHLELEQKLKEKYTQIREKEQRFNAIMGESLDGISLTDEIGKIIEWNHGMENITGINYEGAYGKNLFEITLQLSPEKLKPKEVVEEEKKVFDYFLEQGITKSHKINEDLIIDQTTSKLKTIETRRFTIKTSKGHRICAISRDIIERVKSDLKTKENEQRFKALMNASTDGILLTDESGKIIEWNPEMEYLTGYTYEEVRNKDIIKLYLKYLHEDMKKDDFLQDLQEDHEKMFTKGLEYNKEMYESKILKKNTNEIKYIGMRRFTIQTSKGFRLYAICRDITQKKKEELKILENEQRFKAIMRESLDGIILSDEKGKIIEWNHGMEEITGFSNKYVIGKDLLHINFKQMPSEMKSNEFIETNTKLMAHYLKNGIPYSQKSSEHVIINKKDGDKYIVEIRTFSIKTSKGHRICSIARDITDRTREEELIRENEERFSAIIEESLDGIIFSDENGKVIVWNPAMELITGISKTSAINRGFNEIIYELIPKSKVSENTKDYLKNAASQYGTNGIPHSEKMIEREIYNILDKNVHIVEMRNFSVTTSKGKILCSLARDVTERKKMERKILQSQRLSELNAVVAGVAHDFNNSLQSILGNIELALISDDSERNEYLNTIKKASLDAASRIKQLQQLNLNDKVKGNVEPINLNEEVIKHAISQSRPLWKDLAEKQGNTVNLITDLRDIPQILGNSSELRTVFYNIIKNSIEAMPDGGEIFIETGFKEQNNKIFISIKDNGIGMSKETQIKIFQPFYSTKEDKHGRGLGLSTAHSILKEHGGTIFVKESIIGEGTTMEINLPYTSNEIARDVVQDQDIDLSGCSDMKILVVDDVESIRTNISLLLKKLGNNVEVAENGEEALILLTNNEYEVLITDIGMPIMNGWELIKNVKLLYPDMKIIILSGWTKNIPEERQQFVMDNVDSILEKPITIVKLKTVLSMIN